MPKGNGSTTVRMSAGMGRLLRGKPPSLANWRGELQTEYRDEKQFDHSQGNCKVQNCQNQKNLQTVITHAAKSLQIHKALLFQTRQPRRRVVRIARDKCPSSP